jgi:hypothetical protein
MIDDDCGAIGEMQIGRETDIFGENLPLCTLSTTDPT